MTRTTPTPETITMQVPFRIIKRGGRKEMVLPADAPAARPRIDSALVKAIGRAFRWKRILDSGEVATIKELAEREGISLSYLVRLLPLTRLAPDIVEAILDGRQGPEVTLDRLTRPLPVEWEKQRQLYGDQ